MNGNTLAPRGGGRGAVNASVAAVRDGSFWDGRGAREAPVPCAFPKTTRAVPRHFLRHDSRTRRPHRNRRDASLYINTPPALPFRIPEPTNTSSGPDTTRLEPNKKKKGSGGREIEHKSGKALRARRGPDPIRFA